MQEAGLAFGGCRRHCQWPHRSAVLALHGGRGHGGDVARADAGGSPSHPRRQSRRHARLSAGCARQNSRLACWRLAAPPAHWHNNSGAFPGDGKGAWPTEWHRAAGHPRCRRRPRPRRARRGERDRSVSAPRSSGRFRPHPQHAAGRRKPCMSLRRRWPGDGSVRTKSTPREGVTAVAVRIVNSAR